MNKLKLIKLMYIDNNDKKYIDEQLKNVVK